MIPLSKKFNTDKFSFSLSVEKPVIPEKIFLAAQEHALIEKKETHISVAVSMNAHIIGEVLRTNSPLTEQAVALFNSFAWQYSLTEEYFFHERFYSKEYLIINGYTDLTEHTRCSIVQKVILPDLAPFYSRLNTLLNISLSTPIPHITLFTWADQPQFALIGIGVSSEKEFEENIKERL